MTPEEIRAWIGFRFSEWAILRNRDDSPENFNSYLLRVDGTPLSEWARSYWKQLEGER